MSIIDTTSIISSATSPYAIAVLSLLSISESGFFVIPPEVILIPMALAYPKQALLYGLITSVTSLIGAMIGYWIGEKGGKPILKKFFSKEKINKMKIMYNKYDAWAILIAAFTPLPYKLATISAGVFDLNKKRFLIASAIGRGTRYMLISTLIFLFGEPIKYFIEHQLNRFMLIATVLGILVFVAWKFIKPKIDEKLFSESLTDKIKRLIKLK